MYSSISKNNLWILKYIIRVLFICLIFAAFNSPCAYSEEIGQNPGFKVEINDFTASSPSSDPNNTIDVKISLTNNPNSQKIVTFIIEPLATPGLEVYLEGNCPQKK